MVGGSDRSIFHTASSRINPIEEIKTELEKRLKNLLKVIKRCVSGVDRYNKKNDWHFLLINGNY